MPHSAKDYRVSNPPPRPLLIYDGDCGFCRVMVSRWREWMHVRIDDEPAHTAAPRFPEIPADAFEKGVQLITPDGSVAKGSGAVFEAMSICGQQPWLWWVYRKVPPFAAFCDWSYNWTARHRKIFSHAARFCYGRDFTAPTFNIAGDVFFRLMGLTYLFAFVSLWMQIIGLAGEHGIVPATRLMDAVHEHHVGFWQFPSLCQCIGADNAALNGLCAAGTVAAVLMMLGILPTLSAFASWLLYLSLCSVVETFLNFQWDALLLEAGFLAIFLMPPKLFLNPLRPAAPSRFAHFLIAWLLFRLMFSSGVAKLASNDESWWNLTALTYHYWTQCLPPWTAWYMDKLPLWAQKATCLIMFAIELAVPPLIFFPRRVRHFSAFCFLSLMVVIALTGNYGFFDFLTMVFCVLCFDDHALQKILRFAQRGPALVPLPTRIFRWFAIPVLLCVFALSWLPFGHIVERTQMICGVKKVVPMPRPDWLIELHNSTAQFRSVNGYGLFASMTKQRDEIILEGSDDGVTWKPYEFKWKPGDVKRRPQFCSPHMPRLDWQMWFAALGEIRGEPWLVNTMVRLLEGEPNVIALLEKNPFPGKPPRAIRAVEYSYHFTTSAERGETGAWWKRDAETRIYCPPLQLGER